MKPQEIPQQAAQSDHEFDKHHHHESQADDHGDEHHLREYTSKELRSIKIQGVICLIGGIALHFVLGTFYLWGGISPYVGAYMKDRDPSVTQSTLQIIFPILGIGLFSVLSFGVKLAQRIGYKTMIGLGGSIISLAFLILSFINNIYAFIFIYCFMVGIPSGLVYMLPIICGWKFFPFNRGLVSGLIIAGYGFGAFIFNFVCKAICNPNNEEPSIPFEEDGKIKKYFSKDVFQNVPFMFQMMALSYFILTIIATLLIKYPRDLHLEYQAVLGDGTKKPSGINHEKSIDYHPTVLHAECETLGQGIKSRPFWFLIVMVLCSVIFGLLMANCYKVFGQTLGIDDSSLTVLGSVQSVCNGGSRFLWAVLFDKYGFKKLFLVISVINLICSATIGYINNSYAGYFIILCLTMFCEGGLLSCYPAVSAKVFGHKVGPVIYGGLFFVIGISNMLGYLLYKFGEPKIGYNGVFWIVFGFCCVAFILGVLFKEEHEWKKEKK
ncbi:unnamed protein product (macronuclear) [Paramecium tetraurelia]|uniref:Major facilitator superfamily (MFS) profile domain-containing protein n=1 Tax=Paramecium tetraurelia TaxID=5888 RepID=A0CEI0_PARTE|nr:uncharacterized protein GSPATT00037635001 [Paramecium tetraurelia]CAK69197.1 unnamed protein product [Paramecium tetraurelia]|eukprot:XP_001436594.1 hypothetical protein (macronuclear) [Paramecium tetraurelia strain d4-2]